MDTFELPYLVTKIALPDSVRISVEEADWQQVDKLCSPLVKPGGAVFDALYPFCGQKKMEYIISVRDSQNPYEEDGIWHDDGSRPMAFSLGLNLRPETISGGFLEIREKGKQKARSLPPPEYGKLYIFKTGVHNYEHRVLKVEKGLRLVMAGWCYN